MGPLPQPARRVIDRRPVPSVGCTLALLVLTACQTGGTDQPAPAPRPVAAPPVLARDAHGQELAVITSNAPCTIEMSGARTFTFAARPLLFEAGGVRWTGEETDAGTRLLADGHEIARALETGPAISVFDPSGAAFIRVDAQGAVHGAGGQLLRAAPQVAADSVQYGDATVTGTHDTALAAVLVSPEVPADVRALVACNHLLPAEALP